MSQLPEVTKRGRKMIITLTGDSSFLIKEALKKLKSEFITTHGDLAVEIVDCEEVEIDQITSAIQAQPFLAAKKLVILRSPSANKLFVEQFENLLTSIPENTDVIIVEPKIDRRLGYYKSLKKLTDYREHLSPDDRALSRWLADHTKTLGAILSLSDAEYLINRVGNDQQLLASELSKLIAFEPNITRQSINDLSDKSPQGTVFELLDAALQGRHQKALELYEDQRWQGEEPIKIMAMIGWQLHALALIKAAGPGNAGELAAKTGLHPYVVGKNLPVVRRLTLAKLKELIDKALELEIKLKSQTIDADEALKNYFLALGR